MSRRYVNQLGPQEAVDQIFLASGKQLRPNRNGNLYLQVDLVDRGGTISGRMWNAGDVDYRGFEDGDYVRVVGATQVFQGALQLIISHITKARPDEVDDGDFMPISPREIDRLVVRLTEILRGLDDPHLRSLAECFLMDDEFMRKFSRAPAGVKHHHAYRGGLLQHVVSLLDVAERITPCYPAMNADLLTMGAFLHDVGKIDELGYERSLSYTDEGQLLGHIVMGVSILEHKLREAEKLAGEPIPTELVLRLKHMIVAHHGEYEFGSPKLPMTLEALALHYLDNLDAKMHACEQLIREDPNVDSSWTLFHHNLNRKLFKGEEGLAAPVAANGH